MNTVSLTNNIRDAPEGNGNSSVPSLEEFEAYMSEFFGYQPCKWYWEAVFMVLLKCERAWFALWCCAGKILLSGCPYYAGSTVSLLLLHR